VLLWLLLAAVGVRTHWDIAPVRQVARCDAYVTDNEGRVVFVRVPPALVSAGPCASSQGCCYAPCVTNAAQSLPTALIEDASFGSARLSASDNPIAGRPRCRKYPPFAWVGARKHPVTKMPHLLIPGAARVFPTALLARHGWSDGRFVPLGLAELAVAQKDAWPLFPQPGMMSMAARARGEGNWWALPSLLRVLACDAGLDDGSTCARVQCVESRAHDGGYACTVSAETKAAVRAVLDAPRGYLAGEIAATAWQLWDQRLQLSASTAGTSADSPSSTGWGRSSSWT